MDLSIIKKFIRPLNQQQNYLMKLKLDKNDIIKYQKNRPPYLMIDHATEVIPGVSAKGYKDFPNDEWFFTVHWENDPNVPGMLQIESLVQGYLKFRSVYQVRELSIKTKQAEL